MNVRKVFGSIAVCVSLLGLQVAIGEVQAATGTVAGTVFNDKDSNGTNGGSDVGVSGVVVSAYDSSGVQVGTATTASNGTYSLSIASSTNSNVRIEFTTPSGYQSSFQGANNATSIQFVTIPATNVNYAIHIPGDYCQANPSVAAICIRPSTTDFASSSGLSTMAVSDWRATQAQSTARTTHGETGSLWGMAYDRQRQVIFGSAVLRRHSGLGPQGIAGVYATHKTNGSVIASWDLSQAPFSLTFSADNTAFSNANRGLNSNDFLSIDANAYAHVGKVGIGDIDMSQDGQWLFVSNLYEKKIHRIAVTDTNNDGIPELGAVTSYSIPVNTCANNSSRPWGIDVNDTDGTVLVGVVCSNEGQAPFLTAGTGTSIPDPGKILKLTVATSTFSTLSDVDFDYVRSGDTGGCQPEMDRLNARLQNPIVAPNVLSRECLHLRWHSWTDNYQAIETVTNTTQDNMFWSQPIIADIEVAPTGEVVLGVMDRFGMQMGVGNYKPTRDNNSNQQLVTGWVAGDTVMLCPSGGSYVQNNADDCTPAVADDPYMLQPPPNPSMSPFPYPPYNGDVYWGGVRAGMGGLQAHHEVFDDNVFNSSWAGNHYEMTIGGLAYHQNSKELLITMMDADNMFETNGVRYLEGNPALATFGQYLLGTRFVGDGSANAAASAASFRKSVSMGDVEILCDQAPVQIGNRVWIDTNQNGIQDPGEAPAAGVTVRLYNAAGTSLVGTAVTNNNGEYYFSSTVTEAAAGNGDNIGGGVTIGLAYKIRVDRPEDYASGGPLSGYELTQATATSLATSLDTLVDSNAALVSSYPQLDVVAVLAGANNHTYDVGFKLAPVTTTTPSLSPSPSPSPTTTTTAAIQAAAVIKVSVGDYVWWDTDRDGIQDRNEKGISGVVLSIRTADGKPVVDVDGKVVPPTRTNRNGRYSFDNLPPGQYEVFVSDPRGYFPTTALAGSDRGIDSSTRSAMSMNLTQNGQRDPTLDFGFYKPPRTESVEVGNYVWKDRNGNGIQGPGDDGIAGAVLTLTTVDDKPVRDIFGRRVRSQTTKRDGKYLFTHLPPGQYVVRIKYPPKHFPTTANKPNRAMNSSSHKAFSKALSGGQSDLTLDFGMVYRSGDPLIPRAR